MVTIKWNKPLNKLSRDLIGGNDTAVFAASSWHRLYYQYVPMDNGTLADSVDYDFEEQGGNLTGTITHNQPYAHYQYVGIHPKNGTKFKYSKERHPLATDHWDEQAIADGKAKVLAKDVENYIKRGGRSG